MGLHIIKKGLDLPVSGQPEQRVERAPAVRRVAIVADDYPFMKPSMRVAVGDTVKRGQALFEDRKTPGVLFTAPGAGTVSAIHRGERRRLISVVVELSDGEIDGTAIAHQPFECYYAKAPSALDRAAVRALLVESGLWTALRQRPYSKVPSPESDPRSIFVTAIDTQPLAGDPAIAVQGREDDIRRGLAALGKLTDGPVFLCRAKGTTIGDGTPDVRIEEFEGPHPAGLAGTHIHLLDPVGRNRQAWWIGVQDVAAIGRLFATGELDVERIVSLAGPAVKSPRLLRARLGAEVAPLVDGELTEGEVRVVSGSMLNGRIAGDQTSGYLGRYHLQVCALLEGRKRRFLGFMMPGADRYSAIPVYAGALRGGRHRFPLDTSTNGGHRAMVPIGLFERVMPLDILPTFLLRALVVNDLERAEALGCLELDEEDLALCTFLSPGKEDFGPDLRRALTDLWKEG